MHIRPNLSILNMSKNKRGLDKLDKSNTVTSKAKLSKSNRYNKYFTENNSENSLPEKTDVPSTSKVNEQENSPRDSNDHNQNTQHFISYSKLVEMLKQMSAVNKVVSNEIKTACQQLRQYRTKSTLGIRETNISDDDAPLLTIFEKYKLPLQTKTEVEALDAELEKSDTFLKFFVSSF